MLIKTKNILHSLGLHDFSLHKNDHEIVIHFNQRVLKDVKLILDQASEEVHIEKPQDFVHKRILRYFSNLAIIYTGKPVNGSPLWVSHLILNIDQYCQGDLLKFYDLIIADKKINMNIWGVDQTTAASVRIDLHRQKIETWIDKMPRDTDKYHPLHIRSIQKQLLATLDNIKDVTLDWFDMHKQIRNFHH